MKRKGNIKKYQGFFKAWIIVWLILLICLISTGILEEINILLLLIVSALQSCLYVLPIYIFYILIKKIISVVFKTGNKFKSVNPYVDTTYQSEVPEEIMEDMRSSYTIQNSENNMRIAQESLDIMNKTNNLDTFFSRYETAMQHALTLEQARKADIYVSVPLGFSDSILATKSEQQGNVLKRAFENELHEINKLKTNKGKLNRIDKFIEKVKSYEDEFEFTAEDVYNEILSKLRLLKKEFEDV